jgi:hypothetical protein
LLNEVEPQRAGGEVADTGDTTDKTVDAETHARDGELTIQQLLQLAYPLHVRVSVCRQDFRARGTTTLQLSMNLHYAAARKRFKSHWEAMAAAWPEGSAQKAIVRIGGLIWIYANSWRATFWVPPTGS